MKKKLLCLAITAFAAFNVNAQIGVDATMGTTTGNYPTLKEAFDAINAGTHMGAITLNVLGNTTETDAAVLNASGTGANYTLVNIKPAPGVTATISGSISTAIIRLNGADNVTINGSNNGSSSRNLTISNTFVAITNTNPVVIMAASLAAPATDGCDNFTIRNTNIAGSGPSGTVGGIIVSGSALAAAETSNNNFTAINNTFVRSQNAIFAIGNSTNTDTGWIIRNNEIGSTVAADKMLYRGIAVQNAKNFEISGNVITGVELPANSTNPAQGILIGGTATNGTIFNNNISNIKNLNPSGYGAVGIYLNCPSATANMLVYNNVMSDIAGAGYNLGAGVNDNGNGIVVNIGAGYKIYYNTVIMNTNQTNAGRPSAFNVGSGVTAAGAIDLRNNMFINTQTQAGEKYAIYSAAPSTVFSSIDYNNYYSSGANLGFIAAAPKATLADIQTAFGQNTNSLNVEPVFASATDFRLAASFANAALDNKATPIAEVTTDADGVTRSALTPDLGSFEFSAPASAAQFSKSAISYNNPVNNFLQLRGQAEISSVEIYNITGQAISTSNINATEGNVDMSALSAGIYVVKVNTLSGSESIKIMKK